MLGALGVEPSEERSVAMMTAHAFFMGCATAFFETAASATFLARFAPSYLPWVYVAAAGVNTLTGAVYSRAQSRVPFARLMSGTLWFLLAITLGARVGLAVSSLRWIAFAALVAYRIVSSLTDLEYWAVASRMYDVRQAKRLFGLIGTGEVIARITASFSVPFLVKLGGVSNLMLLSAGALGLCAILARAVLARIPGASIPPATASAKGRASPSSLRGFVLEILRNPYLRLVVGVAVLATFGKYFVDFAFLQQMSVRASGEAQVAGLLGVFSGLTQTLSLLTRLFISRPLLYRFGIRVGVVLLPTLQVLCTAGILVCGLLGLGDVAIFVFVIANQGVYKIFKHPLDNASFKVLYQPLKPEQRLAAQIAVEVLFAPVVVGISGVVMLLFTVAMRYEPVRFAGVLLLTFGAWTIAARAAGRRYGDKLRDMLSLRFEGNVTLPFDDATSLAIVRAKLDSPVAADVCLGLDLLEKAAPPDFIVTLIAKVDHPDPVVRRHALGRLIELKPDALPKGLRAAGHGDDAIAALAQHLEDQDELVRRAALAALFGLATSRARETATATVERFALSEDARTRAFAARAAGDHHLDDVVRRLLEDADPAVHRAAIAATSKLEASDLEATVFDRLRDSRFAQSAALALAARGDKVLTQLEAGLQPNAGQQLLLRLVDVHRLLGTPAAVAQLAGRLEFPDVLVRTRLLTALDKLRYVATAARERARVEEQLEVEVSELAWTLAAYNDLVGDDAASTALRSALQEDLALAVTRVFNLLAFVYERVAIQRAVAHVAHASKDMRAYARELLEVTLTPEHRRLCLPLLDDVEPIERLHRIEKLFPQPEMSLGERLCDVIGRPPRSLRSWTRALAIRAALMHRADGVAAVLERLPSDDPVIEEARSYVDRKSLASAGRESSGMGLIDDVLILKRVPMFARTSDELLVEIATNLELVELAAQTSVFEKGDVGDSLYIVVRGRVRVFDADETLEELGEHEIFGELALLDPAPRSASIMTMVDTQLFRLDAETFSQLMAGNIDIVRGVLHVLCERLRKTTQLAIEQG